MCSIAGLSAEGEGADSSGSNVDSSSKGDSAATNGVLVPSTPELRHREASQTGFMHRLQCMLWNSKVYLLVLTLSHVLTH